MFSYDDPEDKVKAMYRMYDTDKDGSISKKELAKLMSMGESQIGSGMMSLVWSMADEDGDGRLNYDEFCKLLNKYKMNK
jgi:calmodulin